MNTSPHPLPSALREAVAAMRAGRMVIMVDDEKRENEGDLILPAQFANQENIAFMARQGCGLICLALEGEQVDRLGLPPMTENNRDPRGTAFTVSVEAAEGVTTGISAADRALTIRRAADPASTPASLVSPGHVFPLRANPQGVMGREGHTEGAVDLMRLAGLEPAGVICEIMAEDGSMMRLPELKVFARQHGLPLISIAQLRSWIAAHGRGEVISDEPAAHPVAENHQTESASAPPDLAERFPEAVAALPGLYGGTDLKIHAFVAPDGVEHVALVKGDPQRASQQARTPDEAPLVRLHSECVTGDALGSLRCDCGPQLREALARISQAESGVLVYLRGQEGRGIGLFNKIRAYGLQDQGLDTVEANEALGLPTDARKWDVAAEILRQLGIGRLRLLTNNPLKEEGLEKSGLQVLARVPLEIAPNPFNRHYLDTKRTRMGHFLETGPAASQLPRAS
ncbi:3,4-dihydroxy-2-butanone-4-phosphate synthase [Oecophyllibacter saccharovorans]|uniref:3,4-dihydroxy-2-butanone-4-phosphate synthase n=1 Tax=Oecophyllibacter saccharovorans TaxID=2558360 RepID=UPI001F502A87|nr:3,4-dihydroxy-2-butanone-4-phosphate synthase [Oecophyllibacter saccharovorans]